MIERVTVREVLASCRETLGLSNENDEMIDDVLLAALLRRSAGIHCPCSRSTLRASALECTQGLTVDESSFSQRIDNTIEALTIGGDLLELDDVVTEDADVRQTWVFAAPPSFVIRPNGTAFLFGVVPDQDLFLPSFLGDRVLYDRFTRTIEPQPDEELANELEEQGLQRLSDKAWINSPKDEPPHDLLRRLESRLGNQSEVNFIEELKILDSTRAVSYYPDRWIVPKNQTGTFVARRPQEFGAPLWCVVRLKDGVPVRLLDFPFEKTRWRACDTAWHVQMAIDHCRDQPQQYRRRTESDGVRFDFFGPLPQWSQRRLIIFGNPMQPDRSLLSYLVPHAQAETEETFLQNRLWLSRTDDSE